MNAHEMHRYLDRLRAERLAATEADLVADGIYMAELEDELAAARETYIGLAVTEIASLRSLLSGPQVG